VDGCWWESVTGERSSLAASDLRNAYNAAKYFSYQIRREAVITKLTSGISSLSWGRNSGATDRLPQLLDK